MRGRRNAYVDAKASGTSRTPRRGAKWRPAITVVVALIGSLLTGIVLSTPAAAASLSFTDINPDASDNPSRNSTSGGRVNGLAIASSNNQVMYAASEWGGLYKSTNGGDSWFRLNGHLPTVMWDVEVDPTNNNRVYATSFYDGRVDSVSGIQRSTNGGSTWSHPASASPPASGGAPFTSCSATRRAEHSAFGIGIHPTNGDVYIGTNCGVARSTDGGVSWTFSDPTSGDGADDVWDVVVQDDGSADGIVDICGADGVHRSDDGGDSWTSLNAGLPLALAFGRCSIAASPDETYVLIVEFGGRVFETNDGGTTWAEFAGAGNGTRLPFVTTNDRSEGFDLWVGRGVNLARAECTTPNPPASGGAQRCEASPGWDNAQAGAHDDTGDVVFDTAVGNDRCPVLYSSDGGVHTNTITDAGCHAPTWQRSNVGLHALWLYSMQGADQVGVADEDLYMGSQDNGSFASTNAGAASVTWTMPDCCDVFNIAAHSSRVVWDLWGGYSQFYGGPGMTGRTGVNGFAPGTATQGVDLFTFPDNIDTFGSDQFVSVTGSGAFTTDDITAAPVTWSPLGSGVPPGGFCGVQVAMSGGTPTFYAQTGCLGVFETGGNLGPFQLWKLEGTSGSWDRIDDNFTAGGIEIFSVDPTDPDRLYASHLSGPDGVRMIRSDNGGTSWTIDEDLTDLMDGNGDFRMQTQRGPTSFTRFGTYRQPTLVAFDPEDPDIVVAGGRESGVFVSTNGGDDWALVTDPYTSHTSGIPHLPRPWFAYFDHGGGETNVFIGTQGRGVWRLSLVSTDLAIDKTESADPVVAGTELTYTLTAENEGGNTAGNVTVVDDLPGEVEFQSVSAPGWSCDTPAVGSSGEVRCTRSTLSPAASSDISITVEVPASTPHGAVLANEARIFSNAEETDPGDNSVAEDTAVIAEADVSATKVDSVDPAVAGATFDYTITVRNDGPSVARDVVVTDTLPAGVTHQSNSHGCISAATVECSLGDLGVGAIVDVTVTVLVDADLVYDNGSPLVITNSVEAVSSTTDPDPTNNDAEEETLVVAVADLEIVAFVAHEPPPDVLIGEDVDVVLRTVVGNNGPSSPMDVDLDQTASAPAGSTVTPAMTGGVITAVAVGSPQIVDRVYTINCGAPGLQTFSFDATIAPDRPGDTDPDLTNNQANFDLEVDCVVPVRINIQPGGTPNSNNVRMRGVTPLAVLTTNAGEYGLPLAFDATAINPLTVRFGAEPVVWAETGGSSETHNAGHIENSIELDEQTQDGDLDMVLHFRFDGSGLTITDTAACVKGTFTTVEGTFTFFGCDSARIIP